MRSHRKVDVGMDRFAARHIGPNSEQVSEMLKNLGFECLETFTNDVVPRSIRMESSFDLAEERTEAELLQSLKETASKNVVAKSWIGLGYSNVHVPSVIKRNILENPGWYTQYTPYQPEISQGRLESLLNFQTMICDLTGLPVTNASLLDEGTAAVEAMTLSFSENKDPSKFYFVSHLCHPQTIEVMKGRASALGFELVVGDHTKIQSFQDFFGILLQYPTTEGSILEYGDLIKKCKKENAIVSLACDLLSLTLLKSPGELGADIAFGNSQRFGVPLGFGGPHAAFFAAQEAFLRKIPGRIVGVSQDAQGEPAFRLALQTREQHIRRARATSNICTAQALLANMAAMYAVYHGAEGLKRIAQQTHAFSSTLKCALIEHGFSVSEDPFFDTVKIGDLKDADAIMSRAWKQNVNLRKRDASTITVSLDETTTLEDLECLLKIFTEKDLKLSALTDKIFIPQSLLRSSDYLQHEVFKKYRSETELMRYIKKLENKDLSLTHSMIPLGSCTMKLNAASEMEAISWPEFANMHPFAPSSQTQGYREMLGEFEEYLTHITGFDGVSLQPNSGAQGEYAGLLVIKAFQNSQGESQRNVCLIPNSAHGTNPASASLAGLKVVSVNCDQNGNVDISDLEKKAQKHEKELSSFMITYPSTHGVFEKDIKNYCEIVHKHGGQVYMDGANLNAQLGLCKPAELGADVCHLNLHKTFCIPHGGGGPGAGPIAVKEHLKEFLPGHCLVENVGGSRGISSVSSAPYGNAGIYPISYAYIKMMGAKGLREATQVAILSANYIAKQLAPHYKVLYTGESGHVAHECILDMRGFKKTAGVDVFDIAKRLMDYGFHAPTVSFPVAGTFMIEPTESESLVEIQRFCDAMISIRKEIEAIETGKTDKTNNVLKNAPHTEAVVVSSSWEKPYTREEAAFPSKATRENKYWPKTSRVDEAFGDRNFMCRCS